jgi:hypothetical protein
MEELGFDRDRWDSWFACTLTQTMRPNNDPSSMPVATRRSLFEGPEALLARKGEDVPANRALSYPGSQVMDGSLLGDAVFFLWEVIYMDGNGG